MKWWWDRDDGDPWQGAPPWALELRKMLSLILKKEDLIMSEVDDALAAAEAAATKNEEADDAAEQLLVTLSGMIADLKSATTDPATATRILALSDKIKARASKLGDAVVANTPAAP